MEKLTGGDDVEVGEEADEDDDDVGLDQFSNGSTHIAIPPSASQGMMPDQFDGKAGFKTWQDKMRYYLASKNMERYLTEDPPTLPQGTTDVYASKYKYSKALWLALENKYKTDEFGLQRFSTAKFLNFNVVDSKQIVEHVEALQRICQEIELEGMSIYNVFKTNCLIKKLPPVREQSQGRVTGGEIPVGTGHKSRNRSGASRGARLETLAPSLESRLALNLIDGN
ncbi:hypothetical protein ISN45_Aa01g029620 [Arabidopsis thaliana x Arabidopsis arenosa]|uniref:Uncharacterized protein n=1 Tax=Arabidopsis thaliana x Arabidopsis arenosa TaxID=1240361 RepID=A0A8T2C4H9_9BRAS|nr:hypothetical protein ISN45_Aa01g029620 [Arabidopsis thaliana x Arabidopsis arenosa]